MHQWFKTGLFALMVAGCGRPADLDVDGAWVRLPAVPGRPGVAYFTIEGGPRARTLHRVTADYAVRAEMHESMGSGARMSMRPLETVPIPAGGAVEFKPGGRHVMLFDIDRRAKPGASTLLTFVFDGNERLYRKAWIIGPGDQAPD